MRLRSETQRRRRLDHGLYPDVFKRIWSLLDHDDKLLFGQTSKAFLAKIEEETFKHVAFIEELKPDGTDVVESSIYILTANGHLLRGPRTNKKLPASWIRRFGFIKTISWSVHSALGDDLLTWSKFEREFCINWGAFTSLEMVRRMPTAEIFLAPTPLHYSFFGPFNGYARGRVTVVDTVFLHRPSQKTILRLSADSAAKHVLNIKCVAGAKKGFRDLECAPFEDWPNPSPDFGLVLIYHPLPVDEGPLDLPSYMDFSNFLKAPQYRDVTYVGLENAKDIEDKCPRNAWHVDRSAAPPTLQDLQTRLKASYENSTVRFLTHAEYRAEVGDAIYKFETLAAED
jgi:hypothetical protein